MIFPLWILLLSFIGYLAYKHYKRNGNILDKESPEEILRRRYARGEIGEEEFKDLKEKLKRNAQ